MTGKTVGASVPPRRLHLPHWAETVGAPVAGVIVGLLIGALLILLAGADPLAAYAVMARGAFGGTRQIEETLLKAAPLLIMGLGLTAAFRARVWNIGGEGQYYIGALFGGAIALTFPGWPRPLLITAMLVGGVAGGVLWAAIPGLLKVRRGMSEIISTLMLNYIAILFVQYVARGPLQEPGGYLARERAVCRRRAHAGPLRQPDSSGRAPGAGCSSRSFTPCCGPRRWVFGCARWAHGPAWRATPASASNGLSCSP